MTLTKRYESIGVKIDKKIIHIVEYIKQLLEEGKIKPTKSVLNDLKKVTIHDPCLIARNLNDISSIRDILGKIQGLEIVEPTYNKEYVHCCGWSGTAHWADRALAIKEAKNRVDELKETGSNVFLSACPLCELGLDYGISEEDKEKIKIIDISELLIKAL